MELLVNRNDEHFAGVFTDTLMHETDHLFSYLTNPKYVKRLIKVSQNNETAQDCEQFFINNIQSPVDKNVFESNLNKFTDELISKTEITDILQNFRYKTINEINAYNAGKKFLFKERLLNPQKNYPEYHDQTEILHLKEKLDILSKLLREKIQTERTNLKSKTKRE